MFAYALKADLSYGLKFASVTSGNNSILFNRGKRFARNDPVGDLNAVIISNTKLLSYLFSLSFVGME